MKKYCQIRNSNKYAAQREFYVPLINKVWKIVHEPVVILPGN